MAPRTRRLPHLLVLLFIALAACSRPSPKLFGFTQDNFRSTMNCIVTDPLVCDQWEWVIIYYNSTDARQESTFEYLIPGMAKELRFLEQSYPDKFSGYPKFGVVDCAVSGGLCGSVEQGSLPLVVYKDAEQEEVIKYEGYVTLSGLISFVKNHNPKNSLLAAYYKPSAGYLKPIPSPKAQSPERWLTSFDALINPQASNNEKTDSRQTAATSGWDEQIQAPSTRIESQNATPESQAKATSWLQSLSTWVQNQKPQAKQQNEGFLGLVKTCSSWITGCFASIGISGWLLSVIDWFFYIIVFIFLGIIGLILA